MEKKRLTKLVGEDVKNSNASYIADGNVKWDWYFEKQFGDLLKS